MSTITFNIEDDLKKELKKICLDQDTTITEILIEYIKKYVKENKNQKI